MSGDDTGPWLKSKKELKLLHGNVGELVDVEPRGYKRFGRMIPQGHYDALIEALTWIHVHLGSECDWDELDDDSMEARWYRDVSKLLDAKLA